MSGRRMHVNSFLESIDKSATYYWGLLGRGYSAVWHSAGLGLLGKAPTFPRMGRRSGGTDHALITLSCPITSRPIKSPLPIEISIWRMVSDACEGHLTSMLIYPIMLDRKGRFLPIEVPIRWMVERCAVKLANQVYYFRLHILGNERSVII